MLLNVFNQTSGNEHIFLWVGVGIFSLWGGMVRYLMDWSHTKQRCSWSDIATQIVISGFTGFLGGIYCYEQHYSELMTLVVAGISAASGGNLLNMLWKRFLHKRESK